MINPAYLPPVVAEQYTQMKTDPHNAAPQRPRIGQLPGHSVAAPKPAPPAAPVAGVKIPATRKRKAAMAVSVDRATDAPPAEVKPPLIAAREAEVALTVAPPAKDDEEHARRGPSSLKNKEACIGFVSRKGESRASSEGTRMHKYMEDWARWSLECLDGQPDPATHDPAADWDSFDLEQQGILETLKAIMWPKISAPGVIVRLECKLDLRSLGLPGCEFGTADVWIASSDYTRHEIVDYKFGKIEVEDPEENPQFHCYALGVFEHPAVKAAVENVSNDVVVTTTCLQPRLDIIGDARFVHADLPGLRLRLKTITERCEAAGVDYRFADEGFPAIEKWEGVVEGMRPQASLCEYCANVGTCPAVAQFALAASHALEIPPPYDIIPEHVKEYPHLLGVLYAWCQIMEKKFEAVKEEICQLAYSGLDVRGYSLRSSSGKSTIVDPLGIVEKAIADYGLTHEQLLSCSELSITKIAELLGKQAERGSKGKVEEAAKKAFIDGGFVVYRGGYSYLQKDAKKAS